MTDVGINLRAIFGLPAAELFAGGGVVDGAEPAATGGAAAGGADAAAGADELGVAAADAGGGGAEVGAEEDASLDGGTAMAEAGSPAWPSSASSPPCGAGAAGAGAVDADEGGAWAGGADAGAGAEAAAGLAVAVAAAGASEATGSGRASAALLSALASDLARVGDVPPWKKRLKRLLPAADVSSATWPTAGSVQVDGQGGGES